MDEDAPLGQASQEVPSRTIRLEAGHTEPAGLAVILGAAVAGHSVLEDLVAGAGSLQLRGVCEVADNGDSRNVS
jgi:hypothetical protein